ncbi:hybrid sensor histidine kinase/response regulator [Spirulina sp. CS-785/01]|uniref:hybrid sensor histidine kinase/response regulator n=1 Tax=Spirulina sp. CS-785/01 TaxID=3021716 RepID=UPI00232F4F9C|nr:hybrid sensor histidine kinase/response regulator [Spirulina sp. CS-785/01]MDB9314161.1 hybrid sensor histidine kinase/response regulator [Spirulina sp. CS-785/01]
MTYPSVKSSKPNILVIDDHQDNLDLLTRILHKQGYRVRQLLDGRESFDTIQDSPPDLILLDIRMPKIDGYELCRRLKASSETQEIPVIFMSGLIEIQDKILGFEVGGVDYITKPFQYQEVLARVETHLQLRNTQKELQILNQELEQRVQRRTQQLQTANRKQQELLDLLEAKNQVLQETDRLKDEFIQTVSHELRTPLNSLTGFLQLALDGMCRSREEEQEFLQEANESATHLLGLVNEILTVAKMKAGQMSLQLEIIDLQDSLKSALTSLETQYKAKPLDIQLNFTADVLSVAADSSKLLQVFQKVIENAIKFTPQGKITITTTQDVDWETCRAIAQVIIEDTGIGIDPKQQKNLFRPFVMLDGSTSRQHNGLGLGLVIAQQLLSLMGGTIKLESPGEHQGTTVTIRLPIEEQLLVDT